MDESACGEERGQQLSLLLKLQAANWVRNVLKRIVRNALAERSIQEKSISMKLSQPETTGDFFYV
jgi:hypothetical protein